MPITTIRGGQVTDGTVQRVDLDVSTVGQAVVRKLVQGSNVTLSSTGADSGTGDVTINVATGINGFISKTAAYTLTTADSNKYVICSGGSWTLTLPAPVSGLTYQLRNDMGISGTIGTITLQPTGGTIDGLASIALLPQQECTIITDGTNWRTYGLKREVILGTSDITSSTASGTVLLPVGYRYFELQFTGLQPVTNDSNLYGQFSSNGGSSWFTTGYYYGIIYSATTTTVAFLDTENDTQILLTPVIQAFASNVGQSKIVIYPGTATLWPTLEFDSGTRRSAPAQNKYQGFGICTQTGPVNAFKYYMSSGNIANSFLTVKGVV